MPRALRFRDLLLTAALALSLPLLAGFFCDLHPAFDTAAHFRVHLAVLLTLVSLPLLAGPGKGWGSTARPVAWKNPLAAALPLLAGRVRLCGVISLLFGVASLATVSGLPGFGPVHASFQPRHPDAAVYRLLQLNLRFDNAEPGKVLSLIGRVQPDVATLQEVSPMWDAKLDILAASFPFRVVCRNRPFGVAILSRRPLPESAGCSHGGTLARSVVDFGGRRVEVASLHLDWPWPFGQPARIVALEPVLDELSGTALVAGDLNATPWSAAARRLADAGGLTHVGPLGPTWQYRMLPGFLRFAGLPIDQVLSRGDLVVHEARSLEPVGSDHLPVLVEFSLRGASPRSFEAAFGGSSG